MQILLVFLSFSCVVGAITPSASPSVSQLTATPTNSNTKMNSIIFSAILIPVISILVLIGLIRTVWVLLGKPGILKRNPAEEENLVPHNDIADNNNNL